MGTKEFYRYQQAIKEARDTIPHHLKGVGHDLLENGHNAIQYAEEMKSLVFDAIENAIYWTDKANNLEAFRDHILEAVNSLDIAIAVWKRSEEKDTESNRQIQRHHH